MTHGEMLLIALGVLAALGLAGLVGLVAAVSLARRPGRSPLAPIALDDIDHYFRRGAGFAVTVCERTPLAPEQVFARLADRPYLSSLPWLIGPTWLAADGAATTGVGSRRTMSGTVFSVSEQVIQFDQDAVITLTGTAVCLPGTIRSFGERFEIEPTEREGVVQVRWTIAGTPRWVGFLPWRAAAPLARPVFAFVLRHILRLGAFRRPRAGD